MIRGYRLFRYRDEGVLRYAVHGVHYPEGKPEKAHDCRTREPVSILHDSRLEVVKMLTEMINDINAYPVIELESQLGVPKKKRKR
jgi:hypothetical protein